MGKEDASLNLPANGSLSMTLSGLCTWVEMGRDPGLGEAALGTRRTRWVPESPALAWEGWSRGSLSSSLIESKLPFRVPQLSEAGVNRILTHVRRVQEAIPRIFSKHDLPPPVLDLPLILKTANTFPASSGIASSASSFAAVTLATTLMSCRDSVSFRSMWNDPILGPRLRQDLSQVSRQGSGSSCRSFEGPWVEWGSETACQVESSLPEMTDLVVLVSSAAKEVSSSQAHSRVLSSPLWQGRVDRVRVKLEELKLALKSGDLAQISKLAWAEMWEMHSLFHTAQPPFTYWQPDTLRVLEWIGRWVGQCVGPKLETSHPPIVTLDAGPNVHILVESSRAEEWRTALAQAFPELTVLQDRQGQGVTWWEGDEVKYE